MLYGNRWQDFSPLRDAERLDILRAAICYALGEDTLGLARFRERYAGKMGEGPDRRAFDVVTAPIGASAAEFREIARSIASTDTLEAFLRDIRARFAEPAAGDAPATAGPPQTQPPQTQPAQTQAPQTQAPQTQPPQTQAPTANPKSEPSTTGTVKPRPRMPVRTVAR
jgi:hypothetical protein